LHARNHAEGSAPSTVSSFPLSQGGKCPALTRVALPSCSTRRARQVTRPRPQRRSEIQ
jgi:hypothetical protein